MNLEIIHNLNSLLETYTKEINKLTNEIANLREQLKSEKDQNKRFNISYQIAKHQREIKELNFTIEGIKKSIEVANRGVQSKCHLEN